MSWISSALGGVKNAVVGAGHAVGNVASNPWTKAALAAGLAATGVGAPAAAAIMGGTGLLGGALHNGGGLHDAITGGASGAAEGYGAAKAGGFLRGALGIGQQAMGGGGSGGAGAADGSDGSGGGGPNYGADGTGYGGIADASAGGSQGADDGSLWGRILGGAEGLGKTALGGVTGGLAGVARSALGGVTGGAGGFDPVTLGLAGLGVANAAKYGAKADQFAGNAWDTANGDWQARAGLRSQGINNLSAAATPRAPANLASLSAIQSRIAPQQNMGPGGAPITLGGRPS